MGVVGVWCALSCDDHMTAVASYLKLTNEKLWSELLEEMESYYKYRIT